MNRSLVVGLAALVAVALAAVASQAVRAPMLRRFAFRNALRRPGETLLVVVGSLLGTAIITGSFIVGDTLRSSIRATARTQLGPVDELLVAPGRRAALAIERRIAALDAPIDGVMSMVTSPAPVSSRRGSARRAEPRAQLIEVDFDTARRFGDDPAATGIGGPSPRRGEVVLGEDLAQTLATGSGDRITAYLFGNELELRVVRVLPRVGIAGFWTGLGSSSPNAFVAPGTIASARLSADSRSSPPQHLVVVSNEGGVEDSAELSEEVTALLRDELERFPVRVEPIKADVLEAAEREGSAFTELFAGIGSFAIVAGVLLLVNIFVMLSEERKSQLGMLRAIGMRRAHLTRAFVIEGTSYSAIASALGSLVGIAVGWAIVRVAAPIFGAFGEFSLELSFAMTAASLVGGFCIGLLISLVTVAATSARISRLNIIRAIRELPEPRLLRARRRTRVLGALAAIAGAVWFVASLRSEGAFPGVILGLPLTLFSLVPLVASRRGRRAVVIVAAVLSIAWGIFGNRLSGGGFFEGGDVFAFVMQGVMLTFAAVVLLSQTQETLEGAIRSLAASRLSLRLGLAYPLARRFRTGLTLGMYSLVMFTMVFIAVMATVFGGQIDATTRKVAGGFDLVATAVSSNPPDPRLIQQVDGVERVATVHYGSAWYQPRGFEQPQPWTISGVDRSFVQAGPPELNARAAGFDSDREVWAEVVADPATAIVPEGFLQGAGGPPQELVKPGETMRVIDPATGDGVKRRVIGVVDSDFVFAGAYMSTRSVKRILGERIAPTRFFIATRLPESQARDLADRLQGAFIANGLEAKTFRTIVENFGRLNLAFLRLMQGYLALGLIVGIAGLGVVMVRAVRERRREIGVLRALGFHGAQVRRAFTLESAFVALEGIVVGSLLALLVASQLIANGDFGEGLRFVVPWLNVAILTSAAFVASIAATAWPARQASLIAPAVALRIAD